MLIVKKHCNIYLVHIVRSVAKQMYIMLHHVVLARAIYSPYQALSIGQITHRGLIIDIRS